MSGALVDWGAARRVAGGVAGGIGPLGAPGAPDGPRISAAELASICDWALVTAGAHAGVGTPESVPAPELIDRRAWAQNALRTVAAAAEPLERKATSEEGGPRGVLGRLLGGALGAEIGLAVGWAARKVVGQYDLALFGEPRPARLLFVETNVEAVRSEIGVEREPFLRWIALHELTHAIQFAQVDWLAGHVRALAGELLDNAAGGLEPGALSELTRRLTSDPRGLARRVLRGELAQLLASEEQRALLDRLQATMAAIEGHAEHVMDAAGAELGDDLAELRSRLDERRARRRGLDAAIGRLLGMEMKLRQYRLGKAFCDAIVDQSGPQALTTLWAAPENLPSLAELEEPDVWLDRVRSAEPQPA